MTNESGRDPEDRNGERKSGSGPRNGGGEGSGGRDSDRRPTDDRGRTDGTAGERPRAGDRDDGQPARDRERTGGDRRGQGRAGGSRRDEVPPRDGDRRDDRRQPPDGGNGQGARARGGRRGDAGQRTRGSRERRRQARRSGSLFEDLPVVGGVINGVAYYLTGLISVVLLLIVDAVVTTLRADGGAPSLGNPSGEAIAYALGWLFYNAQFVPVRGEFVSLDLMVVVRELTALPPYLYYAIPPVLLFLAGRSVARSHGTADDPNERLAVLGATVVLGYLPAMVAVSLALTKNGVGPALGKTVIVGAGYPLAFGAAGGFLAKR